MVELAAAVPARDWGCSSQGRSRADRPLSLRRDRGDWRRIFCRLIAFLIFIAFVSVYLSSVTQTCPSYRIASWDFHRNCGRHRSTIVNSLCALFGFCLFVIRSRTRRNPLVPVRAHDLLSLTKYMLRNLNASQDWLIAFAFSVCFCIVEVAQESPYRICGSQASARSDDFCVPYNDCPFENRPDNLVGAPTSDLAVSTLLLLSWRTSLPGLFAVLHAKCHADCFVARKHAGLCAFVCSALY